MADRITWYDILGILPGAASDTVLRAYLDKARQLERTQIAGVPRPVITAAVRGRMALDAAWLILGNPAERQQYDEQIGVARKGTGLVRSGPARRGRRSGFASRSDVAGSRRRPDPVEALGVLADWLAPGRKMPRRSRHVTVPDVRGLFFGPCQDVLAKAGFRISTVLMTPQPMPVEGLVVDQSPEPGRKVRRFSTLTLQLWHPPRPQLTSPASGS
jgi:curved DNA-binding protein CbpA